MWHYVLKLAYPDVIYISNSHTEQDGLPAEMVDEHYYSAPEFFWRTTTGLIPMTKAARRFSLANMPSMEETP